ncbi:glycoside hydrolase domain-containing protein [Streptomyces kutzneri]|uniref:glycoside hydrolase domain-containing protein n=1 Tax=Streptomyces kutzneri TaxID=3051179 RepID=UPI0028D818AE|nr:glycoside hydrolase domain-containing protein [Streptomyces sp. DSM 40907]
MDKKVLEAQKWVNQTYAGKGGYNACPENGQTGWSTMLALTRALQIELGIAAPSDSFGPTTEAKFKALGTVGPGYTGNRNIVQIIQHAFFCKGYWGGEGADFGMATQNAVMKMKDNMGLVKGGPNVEAKFLKALLTLDAYVVVSGGTEKVRDIQRWLNGRYSDRSSFNIGPADGIYSRDVQKSLMKALQYESGVADDAASGNFGPTTQASLQAHQVGPGSSGIFVQLFSAACVFNGLAVSFASSYSDDLKSKVTAFQKFSALANTDGRGDYDTWCQLLVSMGNPDRRATACDTRFTISLARAKALKAAGYEVVGRYLDEEVIDPKYDLNKEIMPGELDQIFDGGLRFFPISQYNARKLADFTYSEGYRHGSKAHDRAETVYKLNRGTVIYFAVDYDATDPEISSNIVPYFHGVQAALRAKGKRYLAGVYGSRNVCQRVSDEAYALHSFVSGMSWGFSGNLGFSMPSNWSFTQIKEFKFTANGDTFDLDRNVFRGTDKGVGRDGVGRTESPVDVVLKFVDDLYAAAVSYGKGNPNELVCEYLRSPKYNGLKSGWNHLLYEADAAWLAYADKQVGRREDSLKDPSSGVSLNLDHIAAAANTVITKGSNSGKKVNRGDFAGWGGDLCTFYVEWRKAADSYASGYLFCQDRLAKLNVPSTFSYGDLVEDVDGYLIGTAAGIKSKPINQVFRNHYGSGGNPGHLRRMKDFYNQRFQGSMDVLKGATNNMVSEVIEDNVLQPMRMATFYYFGKDILLPWQLPADKLSPFVSGFADQFQKIMKQENA